MKLFRNAAATVGLMVFSTSVAMAEAPAMALDPASVPALAQLMTQGKKPHFLRHDDTLKLNLWWMETKSGEPGLVYTTLDGRYLFLGYVLDGNLNPLTTEHIEEARAVMGGSKAPAAAEVTPAIAAPASIAAAPVARSDAPGKSANMLKTLSSASTIELGNPKAPLAYVVVDPRCPFCHVFLTQVAPAIDSGKIRLRVIVSNALAVSAGDATAILGSQHPVDMLKVAFFPGSAKGMAVPSVEEVQAAQELGAERLLVNEKARLHLDELIGNDTGVPLIIYRSKTSGKLGTVRGNPADVNALVADAANIDGL